MIVLQLLLYCLLFTAMIKIAVIGGAVNGLYFYPKEVQDRAIELGLIDRNTINWNLRRRKTASGRETETEQGQIRTGNGQACRFLYEM